MTSNERPDPSKVFVDLIRHNSFNSMKGGVIADDLERDRALWDAVLFCYPNSCGITLRDLPSGRYNADTVFLLTDRARRSKLEQLIRGWNCDAVTVMDADHTWVSHYRAEGVYELRLLDEAHRDESTKFSYFLASYIPNDNRVVFQLWWD